MHQKQYAIIRNIIEIYDDKNIDEDNQNRRVFLLFQDLQELGPLPSKLVDNEILVQI